MYKKHYRNSKALLDHIRVIHKGLKHKCTKCSKTYNQRSHLYYHTKVVHEGKIIKCETCTKTFKHRSNLISRIKNTTHKISLKLIKYCKIRNKIHLNYSYTRVYTPCKFWHILTQYIVPFYLSAIAIASSSRNP